MQETHRSPLGKPWPGALALAVGLVFASPSTARANSPYLVVPDPAVAEASAAYRYANMTDAEAFEELDRRKIIYSKVNPVPGVRAPIRLTGRLHGVYIHSALPPDERVTSMFEILDARLALALDDFAALLERHDIDEVVHYTMYRPNVAAPDKEGHVASDAPIASAAASGVERQRAGSRPADPPVKQLTLDKKHDAKREPKLSAKDGARGLKQKSPALAPKKPEIISSKPAPLSTKPAPLGTKPAPLSTKPAPMKPIKGGAPKPVANTPASPAAPIAAVVAPPTRHRAGSVASIRPAAKPFVRRGTWAPPGTRHPAGLAIDVGSLHKRDGRWLSVASHFQGKIGDPTCGADVTFPAQESAHELHSIVCESYALGIFTYVLTPNYNEAHADHFHMEIKPGVRWFLYH